jgi:Plasmid pRiA4b ORF-3-like protein
MIWRQLEVPDSITIAGLHEVLRVAFGRSGQHLHRFTVHGGVSLLSCRPRYGTTPRC